MNIVLGLAGLSLALGGCESINEATGGAKMTPDEFAVVTKQPLVIPPDFNLRPPNPGAADANSLTPSGEARQALFPDPQEAAAALGTTYSESEKGLLARTGAVNVDPNIRHTVSQETGYETDPTVAAKLLTVPPTATNQQAAPQQSAPQQATPQQSAPQ